MWEHYHIIKRVIYYIQQSIYTIYKVFIKEMHV